VTAPIFLVDAWCMDRTILRYLYKSKMNTVTGKLLTFPDPQKISLSIRASALVFADPESKKLLSLIERVALSEATAYIFVESRKHE